MKRIRALGLISGGLDSSLAAKLLMEQGIEVIGLHFESPTACRADAREVARELGIALEVRPKGEEYLRLLRNPRFGYGRNMNPCIDCRLFMFQLGRPYLEELDAQFLFSGEVLGQRPMSQTRAALEQIDRVSELGGWILRPLSAQLLPETEPEKLGWVDRTRLLGIFGRGRHPQLALAEKWGLSVFQSPGGGCLLTDSNFSAKLSDLFEHSPEDRTSMADVELLRIGRHFRIDGSLKIVLGRDQDENRRLAQLEGPRRWCVTPEDFSGPTALVCGSDDESSLERAIELIARYSRPEPGPRRVRWRRSRGEGSSLLELATAKPA